MPLKIDQRDSGIWRIRGTFCGVRVDQSASTRSRQVADKIRAALENRILQESVSGPAAVVTFEESALAYMDAGGEARFLKPLLEYFAGRRVASITRADLDAAASAIYPDCAPSTWNRQALAPMSAVLNYAAAQGWRAPIRIRKHAETRGRLRWLRLGEAAALVDQAGPLHLFVVMALESGARSGELLALDWRDVDLAGGRFTLWESGTKNRRQRVAYFGERSARILATVDQADRVGAVIRGQHGGAYKAQAESGGIIAGTFSRACARASAAGDFDLAGVTPHTLRHTWATWACAVDPNLLRVKQHGGWSSTSQLERYAKLAPVGYGAEILAQNWALFGRTTSDDVISV